MITTKEYLQFYNKFDDATGEEQKTIKDYNRELINKYPWLLPRNRWTGGIDNEYDYSYTELDSMPDGWRIAFGEQMQEEIKQALLNAQEKDPNGGYPENYITTNYDSDKILSYVDGFRIMEIKEKFGGLRFYCGSAPQEVHDIIHKYEDLSFDICFRCGEPVKWVTNGWINYFCDNCAKELFDREESYVNKNNSNYKPRRFEDMFTAIGELEDERY